LTRIPGIGKKTAERLVLELRDKLPVAAAGEISSAPARGAVEEDVLSALVNLGYQRPAAEKALSVAGRAGDTFEAMFKQALAVLSK
jgi:holliday junction DNA helicase RuvA